MISKHRLEALSDGVFAIVMTLLVLDLKVPAHVADGQLLHALSEDAVQWSSFLLTFFIAARYWVLQHHVFSALSQTDTETTTLTMVFLCLVTILPFTASLLGRYGGYPLAFFLYSLNALLLGGVLLAQFELARARQHLTPEIPTDDLRRRLRISLLPMVVAVATVLVLPLRLSIGLVAFAGFLTRPLTQPWMRRLLPHPGKSPLRKRS